MRVHDTRLHQHFVVMVLLLLYSRYWCTQRCKLKKLEDESHSHLCRYSPLTPSIIFITPFITRTQWQEKPGRRDKTHCQSYYHKPITTIETETLSTNPKPQQNDIHFGIPFIHDCNRKQRSTTAPSNYVIQNCAHSSHSNYQKKEKKGMGWQILKHQWKLVCNAYQMAVLASLTYHDFCNNSMHHNANHPHWNSCKRCKIQLQQ